MSKKLLAVILASTLLLASCNAQGESKSNSSSTNETTKVETSTNENSNVKPLIKYNGAVYEMQENKNKEKLTEIPKDKGLALDAKVEKQVSNETSSEDFAKEKDLTARNMPLGTLIYANEDKDTIYVSYLDPEDYHVSLYAIFTKVK